MGFWNALSALAPIAPAMSDAKDLRTAREQDAAVLWFVGPQDAHVGASFLAARRLNASVESIESGHERGQVQVR